MGYLSSGVVACYQQAPRYRALLPVLLFAAATACFAFAIQLFAVAESPTQRPAMPLYLLKNLAAFQY